MTNIDITLNLIQESNSNALKTIVDAFGVVADISGGATAILGVIDFITGSRQKANDGLAEMRRASPDRFLPLASLPLQDVMRAARELDRAEFERRFGGFVEDCQRRRSAAA